MSFLNTEDTRMIAKVDKAKAIATIEDVASTVALGKLNVLFVNESVRVGDIDRADDTFQTRLAGGSFSEPTAAEYSRRMKKGDVFPEVTLQRKQGKSRFRIVCGRHRVVAMWNAFGDDATVNAKVVSREVPADSLKCVGLRDNTTNGIVQSPAEAVTYVARLLFSVPTQDGSLEHSGNVVKEYAINAGAHPTTVTTHYRAMLAEQEFVVRGFDQVKIPRGVLAEAWLFRSFVSWNDIVLAINDFPTLANLENLLRKARTSKTDPSLIPKLIRDAGLKAHPRAGAWSPREVDRIDLLNQQLALAIRCFSVIEPRRNLDEERAEEIVLAVECLRKAMREWKDK